MIGAVRNDGCGGRKDPSPDKSIFAETGADDRASRQRKSITVPLGPCLTDPIDVRDVIPDPFDLWPQLRIALMSGRCV